MAKQGNYKSTPRQSGEQRARRRNQIILAVFSILIISIWIITMIVR
jgi:hypothetical protein